MNKVSDKECAICTRDTIRVAKSKILRKTTLDDHVLSFLILFHFNKVGLGHANNASSLCNSTYSRIAGRHNIIARDAAMILPRQWFPKLLPMTRWDDSVRPPWR